MNSTNNKIIVNNLNMDFTELSNWMEYLYPFHMGKRYNNTKCRLCGEIFSDLFNCDQHMKNKHKTIIDERMEKDSEINETKSN